jgi:hypothetical protein
MNYCSNCGNKLSSQFKFCPNCGKDIPELKDPSTITKNSAELLSNNSKIKCPKCDWQPDGVDHWSCTCMHIWNTFDTRGVCPNCQHKWEETQCPECDEMSPHEDWYSN